MNDFSHVAAAVAEHPSEPKGRNVVRRTDRTSLTPRQLAERSIIPYLDGTNRQLVDSFRELRTKLLATSSENFITLVAPVSKGCGGSFVARNLALAMRFDPAKTALLIDCDFQTPSQHSAMRVDSSGGGLADYLENPEAEVEPMLHSTGVARLTLIPAGNVAQGELVSEQFTSFRMRLLMDSLKSSYTDRYIVLDGPPVLGSPDARMLSDLADVVVLVAGYGRNTAADIAQAAANFDPRKFAGVVFNENT